MIFSSRKDAFFIVFTFGTILLLVIIFILDVNKSSLKPTMIWVHLMDLMLSGFLLWLFYSTNYEISDAFIHYKNGPFHGKIEINKIKEIVKGKTSWIGTKPATARKGLIIKYGKFYDEVYISPETNNSFLQEVLKINPEINIIQE